MSRRLALLLAAAALMTVGCADLDDPSQAQTRDDTATGPVPYDDGASVDPTLQPGVLPLASQPAPQVPALMQPTGPVLERVPLTESLGVESMELTGVTIEPGTDRVVVLDAERGLFARDDDGTFTQIWSVESLADHPEVEVLSAFTDVVALEEGVFALSALADGFLLDLEAGTFQQHFCYEPGWDEPILEEVRQITYALAYDPHTRRIFAQPQTVDANDLSVSIEAFVATYDRILGADLEWYWMPDPNYAASGMDFGDDDTVLFSNGARIDQYSLSTAELTTRYDLSEHVTRIEGLAIDDSHLYLVDGETAELVVLDLAAL